MNQPAIGTNVLWYANADKNSKPVVAVVIGTGGPGQLTLIKFPMTGGEMTLQRCVHHVSDPALVQKPVFRTKYGGWDAVGSDQKSEPIPAPTKAQPQPIIEEPPKGRAGRPASKKTQLAKARSMIEDGATGKDVMAECPDLQVREVEELFASAAS